MIGMRQRIAISCARRIFLIVSGHHEPAFTVASFATTTTGAAVHDADAGDDAGGGRLAVVLVVRDEQADLDEARAGVAEPRDALARRQLSLRVLLRDLVGAAALAQARLERAELGAQLAEPAVSRAVTLPASTARRTTP